MVLGKVRLREAAPQFWLWTVIIFFAFGVIYWHISERQLQSRKSTVMARQRAIAHSLTPKLVPLRDQVEGWVEELAGPLKQPIVSPDLSLDKLANENGLYLRLMMSDTESTEKMRHAAERSLHDGFTSCLFVRGKGGDPAKGKRCYNPSNCPSGELCNEWNVCAPPSQPFNVRLMYRAFRVLSDDWSDDLHSAGGDYEVRLFERDLDKVSHTDVPIAIELFTSAKYFTAVLDELPKDGIPPVPPNEDEPAEEGMPNPEESEALRIQGVGHMVRVGIWELESGRVLYRAREFAGAKFVPLGKSANTVPGRTQRAQQRQVNNCSIAQAIRERVGQAKAD